MRRAGIHALIDAKIRLGCSDFEPEFTLHHADPDPGRWPSANWNAQPMNADGWKPDCAEAFRDAVTHTRGKYDIAW